MNTFRAILLPCAGTAGGVPANPCAAGRPIIVSGDLSARRPGSGWTRNPVRLPAERPGRGAIINSISHREGFGPIFAHAVVPVRRAVRASTMAVHTMGRILNHDRKPARNLFLGLGRALQPFHQPARCLTQTLHLHSSFPNASACHEQSDTKERQGVGKRPQELVRQGQGDE